MKQRPTRIIYTIALLLILVLTASTVQAQSPDDTETSILAQNAEFQSHNLLLLDLGYEDQLLDRDDDDNTYDIYLPSNTIPVETGNYFDLVFTHNLPQTDKVADLSVSLNGTTLETISLDASNAEERSRVRIELPAEFLQPLYNQLRVKLNTNFPCREVETVQPLATVHKDSLIHLEYTLLSRQPDLSIYPLPFYEHTFLPSQVYLVLPQNPTAIDISAAASISAGLGKYSRGEIQIASVLESELTTDIQQNHNLIVIGKANDNRLLTQLDLPLSLENLQTNQDNGILQEITSPWNPQKMVLVVTGQSDQGLLKAAKALNRRSHFLGMKGPVAIVDEILPPPQTPIQREIDITFDDLGYTDASFYGVREQTEVYDFWMPLSWEMPENPTLFLAFKHSTAIDPEQSTLDVELNGVPVGGTLLNAQNAVDGLLEIELPDWLLESGRNRLLVHVGMVMGDYCTNLSNRQAWTVIRRDSFVHLPYVEQDAPYDLALFPYPFNTDANLTDVSFVIPDGMNGDTRDGVLQFAALLGSQANGDYLSLQVVDAQGADSGVRQTNHLIVMGRPTRNSLLTDLNEYLPQPFKTDTDQLVPVVDSVTFIETVTRNAGLIQELDSPWNPNRSILVITGTSDQGLSAAFDLMLGNLPETVNNVSLGGNLAVIEGEQIFSTDTRLLAGQSDSYQSNRVEPVTRSGTTLQREVANRWW